MIKILTRNDPMTFTFFFFLICEKKSGTTVGKQTRMPFFKFIYLFLQSMNVYSTIRNFS